MRARGINLWATCPHSELDMETVKSILAEYKIHSPDVTLRSDVTSCDLDDVVEGKSLHPQDQISTEDLDLTYKVPHCLPISAHHCWNFDDTLEKIWNHLKLLGLIPNPQAVRQISHPWSCCLT